MEYGEASSGEANGGDRSGVALNQSSASGQANATPKPGFQTPAGTVTLEEYTKDWKQKQEMLKMADDIKIEPSCIRMAMPETAKEAQRCVEMLEAHKPQEWEDIDGLKREIPNSV